MEALEHPNEWPTAAKTTLTRKIGPLPVWGWGAVVVGGLVAVRVLHHSRGSAKATPSVQTGAVAVGSPGGSYGGGGGGGGGSTAPSVPGLPTTPHPGGVSDSPVLGGVTTNPQSTSAFMKQYGATPSTLYDQTMAKIRASSSTDVRNGVTYSKTRSEWEALFSQYGGPAGLAAYQVTTNLPTPTAILNGIPTSGPSKPTSGGQAVANSLFTGVVGTTGPSGIVYQGYKDGKLVGQTTGGPKFDTAAWGASLGLNPNNWYA